MPRIAPTLSGLLVVVGWLALVGTAFAVDPWEDAPPHGAAANDPRGVPRSALTADDYPAPDSSIPPRPLPLRLEGGPRPAAATESLEEMQRVPQPQQGHRPIPLAPESAPAPGALAGSGLPPAATGAISLGIVLGLFFLVVLVVRRGTPKHASLLPREAVELLGRAPLVGRQQVHLMRCGNKILLLSISPGSVETLTEITDPLEVDRLAGICQASGPQSMTTSFRHALNQFGKADRSAEYLSGAAADDLDYEQLDVPTRRRGQESRA